MAEETHNSAENAPKGIINTCFATGIGGMFVLFALLFSYNSTTVDDYMLAGTGNGIVDIFLYTTGSTWGQALSWIIVINFWLVGLSSVTVTGRITYALTRDGAFMYSEWLSYVDPVMKSPARAIMFVFLFDSLFLLLPLDPKGALAFYAIVALSTFGFQVLLFTQ
jgi:amino acid transporter